MSVFNSSAAIDADNLIWDITVPNSFACQWSAGTGMFSDCACTASTCAVTSDGDGMDAVPSDTGAIYAQELLAIGGRLLPIESTAG